MLQQFVSGFLCSFEKLSFFYGMNQGSPFFRFLTSNKSHLIAGIGLAGFVGWAIMQLGLPLFWDEIGVYGRGIFEMIDNRVSLHPDALPPDISRGHPLLFTYLIAGWANIFGSDVIALRAASLTVSVGLLLSVYWLLRHKEEAFSPLPIVFILIQPIFLAQSTLVLPEMMLSLFTILAIGAYLRGWHILYFLAGSAMILTKETGIILVGGFAAFHFLHVLIREKKWIQFRFLLYLLPVVPYLIFLMIQKQTHGWYLFPYHVGGFNLTWPAIEKNLIDFLSFIFLQQGRRLWIAIAVVILLSRFLRKPWRTASSLQLPSVNTICLFLSGLYLAFYGTTYYMNRYILVVIILMAVVLGRELWSRALSQWGNRSLMWLLPMVLGIVIIQLSQLESKTFKYDEDMTYRTYVEAQKQAIDYFFEQKMHEGGFHVGFPLDFALLDSRYGYMPDSMSKMLNYEVNEQTKHILTIDPQGLVNNPKEIPTTLVKSWKHGYVELRHYRIEEQPEISQ